nr:phospholipase-like protein [Tanacetum cinerariifolium]
MRSSPLISNHAICYLLMTDYHARVHDESKLHYFSLMKDRLGLDRCVLFKETCFRRWLDLTYIQNEESLIHYMLHKQKFSDNDHYDLPLIYNVNKHTLHFGRHEFGLISRFKIGEYAKNIDLLSLIEDEERFTSLSDSDSIRVCLLLSLEVIFTGHDLGSDGENMWQELYAAIKNVNSNHKQAYYKPVEINPDFVSTYSLSGFVLCFKIWILESSSMTDRWWSKVSKGIPRGCFWLKHFLLQEWEYFRQLFPQLSLARILREKDKETRPVSQSFPKEVSLKDPVKALKGLCGSLMILPKEIKSLKARVYKLESIINVVTKKPLNQKHKDSKSGKHHDLGEKYWSDQDEKYLLQDDFVKAQKLEAEKIEWQSRGDSSLKEENSMKSIDSSKSSHMRVALERCGTNKRRYVNVLRPPIEEDTPEKVLVVVDRHFWDSLIGLDKKRLGCTLNYGCGICGILDNRVMIGQCQKTYDSEYRPWYVKMRSCLESKLHVVLQQTVVLAHRIPLDVEDPIQKTLAYREKIKMALLAVSSNVLAMSSNVVAVSSNVLASPTPPRNHHHLDPPTIIIIITSTTPSHPYDNQPPSPPTTSSRGHHISHHHSYLATTPHRRSTTASPPRHPHRGSTATPQPPPSSLTSISTSPRHHPYHLTVIVRVRLDLL